MPADDTIQLVKSDALHNVIEATTDIIELRKLLDSLMDADKDLECQIATRTALLAEYRQKCLRKTNGKIAYLDKEAEHANWKARALRYKQQVLSNVRHAKTRMLELRRDMPQFVSDEALQEQLHTLQQRIADLEQTAIVSVKNED